MLRRIDLEGAVNFRDIGGYPAVDGREVRWRRMFRSDNLGALTVNDHARIAELGVRTLIDFRLPSERRVSPNVLAADTTIETVEIGFLPEGAGDMLRAVSRGAVSPARLEAAFVSQYRRFVTDHSPEFARALTYALDERHLPLLVHCTSGKDRTGFAISALLMALGTPTETILADYTLTNSYQRDIAHLFGAGLSAENKRLIMTAQPMYLQAAFDQIAASYGSIDAYVERGLGLDDVKRSRLVALLTHEAPRTSLAS